MYYVFIWDGAVDLRHMTRMDSRIVRCRAHDMCLTTQFSKVASLETVYKHQNLYKSH
jgi:hypothetical protein